MRLTKVDREDVLERAYKFKFNKAEVSDSDLEAKLACEAYEALYKKVIQGDCLHDNEPVASGWRMG